MIEPHVVIFGGKFDPPHTGHLNAIMFAFNELNADRVILMPSGRHAWTSVVADLENRQSLLFALCRPLSFGEGVRITGVEGRLAAFTDGPIYTVDSVPVLIKEYAEFAADTDPHFTLLVGSDEHAQLDKWHDIDRLRTMLPIAVYERAIGGPSSTEIRKLLAEHKMPPKGWIPKRVLDLIFSRGLYGTHDWKRGA